jgi:hypothetical protein
MDKVGHDDVPSTFSGPLLLHCPACGSDRVEPVVEGGPEPQVHHFCAQCGRCWHVALGAYWRVSPDACAGCSHREQCRDVYAADHV